MSSHLPDFYQSVFKFLTYPLDSASYIQQYPVHKTKICSPIANKDSPYTPEGVLSDFINDLGGKSDFEEFQSGDILKPFSYQVYITSESLPIPQEIFNELGGLNEWGEAIDAQKFVKYCK